MDRYTIITVPSGTVVEQSDGRIVIKNDYYSEFSRCATVTVVEAETVDMAIHGNALRKERKVNSTKVVFAGQKGGLSFG